MDRLIRWWADVLMIKSIDGDRQSDSQTKTERGTDGPW